MGLLILKEEASDLKKYGTDLKKGRDLNDLKSHLEPLFILFCQVLGMFNSSL